MMNIIAFDIGSEVTVAHAIRATGSMLFEEKLPTDIRSFREVIQRVPKPRCVVFEECAQAAWLWSELERTSDDILVCDPRKNKQLSGSNKSDSRDARSLCQRAHAGALSRVWHGGKELQELRETVKYYQMLTEDSTRIKNRIRGVFRARGLKCGRSVYDPEKRHEVLQQISLASLTQRVLGLCALLDAITHERALGLRRMVEAARKHKCYRALRTVPGVGPIFTAFLLAIIGDPERFRTRRQLWSYAGLAVVTHETGEYTWHNGAPQKKRERPRTRGLVRAYNRTLKYVFKQAAFTLSRTAWRDLAERLRQNSKNRNNVQLTLARRHAAIVLQVMKRKEKYDVAKAFKQH